MYELDNPYYIVDRINRTIVCDKGGNPVFVEEVQIGNKKKVTAVCRYLKELGELIVLPLDDLCFVSPQLGYFQQNENAVFCSRLPVRRDWKQGLRSNNLVLIRPSGLTKFNKTEYKYLLQPIKNIYPNYRVAIEMTEDIYESVGFSRKFCVDKNGIIWYSGYKGVGHDKNGVPTLSDRYLWLTEELSGCVKHD